MRPPGERALGLDLGKKGEGLGLGEESNCPRIHLVYSCVGEVEMLLEMLSLITSTHRVLIKN